jgi:putative membrane protein
VLFGLKGWEFYVYNWAFWAKMAAFAAVGLLSIQPTLRFISWNKALSLDGAFRVPGAEIAAVRRFMRTEVVVFFLIPVFAAIMARGIGY